MGNIRSVVNALEEVGANVTVADRPSALREASAIVLPGVGAFKEGMMNLQGRNFIDALHREVLEEEKPFLGICLGMQLIATEGFEHGLTRGLGWISGKVVKLTPSGSSYRVPHIGWNDIDIIKHSRLFAGIESGSSFYFVHSYCLVPDDREVVTSLCYHGQEIVASIEHRNIFAVQFHPEKSQEDGIRLLRNFVSLVASHEKGDSLSAGEVAKG